MLRDRPERMDMRNELDKKAWIHEFFHGSGNRYVFGCNQWGASIAEHVQIDGFIDDVKPITEFHGVPVLRSESINRDCRVVSAVVLGRPLFARDFLNEKGFSNLDYFSFSRLSGLPLEGFEFLEGGEESIRTNESRFARVRNLLADDESVDTFDRIMEFRKTFDLNVMSPFTDRQLEQYFEKFFLYPPDGVFYDVGSFDGSTSLEFARRSGVYKAIHVFEPSTANRELLMTRLKNLNHVHVHGMLLGGENRKTRVQESGSASKESLTHGQEVEMMTLDSLNLDPPTLVKVDIEGAELDFLAGAATTIRQYKPVIAIACYHNFDHLWKIPEMVLNFNSDYSVYLRHYTEGITETDLFFVPRG
jgi:FkbM family methyltransferase